MAGVQMSCSCFWWSGSTDGHAVLWQWQGECQRHWWWRILDIASTIRGVRWKDEFASGMAPWWKFIDNLIWHLRSLIVMIVFILILLFSLPLLCSFHCFLFLFALLYALYGLVYFFWRYIEPFGHLHLGFMLLFFPLSWERLLIIIGTAIGIDIGGWCWKQYRWGVLKEFTCRYGLLKDRPV